MDDGLDRLQEEIDSEMRRVYTQTVIDHAMHPRNVGILAAPDGYASFTGPCGDTMEIWLKVRKGSVERATFWTDGCGTSIACGSMVTELARGRSVEECLRIGQRDVLEALGDLPEESRHCALLAATTLEAAVNDYLDNHKKAT
jgi:nitrogen fixation NifU-like protein